MTYDDLPPRDEAFINELGAGSKTVVSAQLVSALNGNGNAAIYLSQLLWWGKRKADEDGWFFRTRDQMQDRCGLGKQAQRTAEKTLKTLDLIETDTRGMPAKKHYRLHYEELISLLSGAEPDVAPTRNGKAQGVGGPTSSGGYPHEQDAGGTCQNPIENNTENNTRERAPACEEDQDDTRDRLRRLRAIASAQWGKEEIKQFALKREGDAGAWRRLIYQLGHPDYNPSIGTLDEWQTLITDPVAWAEAVKVGVKRGWQSHTVDAREDTYHEIREQQGHETPNSDPTIQSGVRGRTVA